MGKWIKGDQDRLEQVAKKHGLREFQQAAVERIVNRLTDQQGSGRFLLADEVGLGKTFVAKGVIDELEAKKRAATKGDGFTVVYICSNAEIADQNLGKLCDKSDKDPNKPRPNQSRQNANNRDESSGARPGRLTLLSLKTPQIRAKRKKGERQVFGFTPRTSLQINNGTGIAEERRLLLYLLARIWRKQTDDKIWRSFFKCSAKEGWMGSARLEQLREEFGHKISPDFLAKLKTQWGMLEFGPFDGKKTVGVKDCIDRCVRDFKADKSTKARNLIIGALRKGLASVSLDYLAPDLILLDEFQRFSEILVEKNKDSVAAKLFSGENSRMLILSATPFKMLTLQHEKENHHEKFFETLEFLKPESRRKRWLGEIKDNLKEYKKLLLGEKWVAGDDNELIDLRRMIEKALKEVMCRTERNLYLDNTAKGIKEISPEEPLLNIENDVVEYLTLQEFLSKRDIADWNILDYWKSSPSPLSFMDTGYELIKKIKSDQIKLPPMVLRKSGDLSKCSEHNAKFRLFYEKLFGKKEGKAVFGPWKYLWVRPTCCYYENDFFNKCGFEPTKFLVFSHWRFVPKAVSVLTSMEAARQICGSRGLPKFAPLQFKGKRPSHVFEVCFPSPALAVCIDPQCIPASKGKLPKESELRAEARKIIKKRLGELGVKVGRTNSAPLWKIVALMDANTDKTQIVEQDGFQDALSSLSGAAHEQSAQYMRKQGKQYADWIDDFNWTDEENAASGLSITKKRLDRLVDIALFSPGVSMLRSCRKVLPEKNPKGETAWNKETWRILLGFCFGPLRQYFNKPFAQAIINRNGSGKTYADKVLSYCRQAHLQATMDEYAHLVFDVLGQKSPQEFIAHVGRAIGMWTGSIAVNNRDAQNRISPKRLSTHFALAFGDDVSNESQTKAGKNRGDFADATKKARKSEIREAFNSPFWPFVLATTSVGQEGLDFHLYCRDILHWNLPSNPVDLEQREGRINRFKGLSIRRNARKSALQVVLQRRDNKTDLWKAVFDLVENEHGAGRFRHGLSPCWIYRSNNGNDEENNEEAVINRHLLFLAKYSRDRSQYDNLKKLLTLYRLAFGQPRQKDMLDSIMDRHKEMAEPELKQKLEKYMIDLSPFDPEMAISRARKWAEEYLDKAGIIETLQEECDSYKNRIPTKVRKTIEPQVSDLFKVAQKMTSPRDDRRCALAAILYLLDPFDKEYDRHGEIGFEDDIKVIQDAHSKLCIRTK